MAITRTPWIDDDGTGTTGTIINNAEKTKLYDQIDAAIAGGGAVVDTPFSAAHYAATAGMTWTVTAGQVTVNSASAVSASVFWALQVGPSTLAGTASDQLNVTFPGGVVPARPAQILGMIYNGPGWSPALLSVTVGSPTLRILKLDATNFALGTVYVAFELFFFK